MIVIDVETTGLFATEHSLLSIGAVDFSKPENQFYEECRAWEGAKIDQKAIEVNGTPLSEVNNQGKQIEAELVRKFIDWALKVNDMTMGGFNTSFDREFVRNACIRGSVQYPFTHRTVDLHSVAYAKFVLLGEDIPLKNNSSSLTADRVLRFSGLPEEPRPHNGLTGAKMEAESFSRFLYGRGLFEEFNMYPVPDELKRLQLF